MIALGEWFVGQSQSGVEGEATADKGDNGAKLALIESTQAKWLRSVCREVRSSLYRCA